MPIDPYTKRLGVESCFSNNWIHFRFERIAYMNIFLGAKDGHTKDCDKVCLVVPTRFMRFLPGATPFGFAWFVSSFSWLLTNLRHPFLDLGRCSLDGTHIAAQSWETWVTLQSPPNCQIRIACFIHISSCHISIFFDRQRFSTLPAVLLVCSHLTLDLKDEEKRRWDWIWSWRLERMWGVSRFGDGLNRQVFSYLSDKAL